MNKELKEYFNLLIESLYARVTDDEETEDLILEQLDDIWWNLPLEETEILNKIISQFHIPKK